MCGRINLKTPAPAWAQLFLPRLVTSTLTTGDAVHDLPPRYNIAPTESIAAVIAQNDGWSASTFRWGLVPSWADELAIGNRMINARSETAHEKPSFKRALARRRCLIPVDGYYEWKKLSDGKQPYFIHASNESVLALAGLWETNTKVLPEGGSVETCAILTTSANASTRSVHDRMPVIIEPQDFEMWLDPNLIDASSLTGLLKPANSDLLQMRPVSRYVNDARNKGPRCLEPGGSSV